MGNYVVIGKHSFGENYVPLFHTEAKTEAEGVKKCVEFIRGYRAGSKKVEFKIKDQATGEEV